MKTEKELQQENKMLKDSLEKLIGLIDWWIEDGYIEPEAATSEAYKKAIVTLKKIK